MEIEDSKARTGIYTLILAIVIMVVIGGPIIAKHPPSDYRLVCAGGYSYITSNYNGSHLTARLDDNGKPVKCR